MKVIAALCALSMGFGAAEAHAGCITGAAVGAVAGHMAHHHAMAGAVAGCVVGHEMAVHKKKEIAARKAAEAQAHQAQGHG